jgi:N-acetylmuramoyl-L-alanine amidase
MAKIILDAGHGFHTAGKRTPDGKREWSFNNSQLLYCKKFLEKYENVEILRTDDPTGKTDISLNDRIKNANSFNGDIFVSFHNNALGSEFKDHEGMETFIFPNSQKSSPFQKLVHPLLLSETKNKDRGMKQANYAVLRETTMSAILLESFFMDSKTDYKKLTDETYLKNTGEAIAKALVINFNLQPKKVEVKKPVQNPTKKVYRVQVGTFSSYDNAKKLSEELKKKGYENFIN